MATKKSKKPGDIAFANLSSGIPEGHTTIDRADLDILRDNEKRVDVLNRDTTFDSILMIYFPQRDKVVKKLFEPTIGGPLVSLTHKARLAYALGLIDKTTQNDLEQIHKIRNEFAHNVKMSFAHADVLKHVRGLSTAKKNRKVKVTVKNSYKFYDSAWDICVGAFEKAIELLENKVETQKD